MTVCEVAALVLWTAAGLFAVNHLQDGALLRKRKRMERKSKNGNISMVVRAF